MKCRVCDTELTELDLFCYHCGTESDEVECMLVLTPPEQSAQERQTGHQLFVNALNCAKRSDFSAAAQYYMQAASYDHLGAKNNLGNLYKSGRGVARDPEKAVSLFEEAAMFGEVYAMRNLAACYLDGCGTDKNDYLAVEWLITAVRHHKDAEACVRLAKFYEGYGHRDELRQILWRKKAVEYGHADSMLQLAEYYVRKKEFQQAEKYYDQAGNHGTPDIVMKVAQAYDAGMYSANPMENLRKAKALYIKLTEAEEPNVRFEAAKGLDVMYDYYGVEKRPALDLEKAYYIYRGLAGQRHPQACLKVGYFFEMGYVERQNLNMAIMWYEQADSDSGRRRAEWCKRKRDGALADTAYELHKHCQVPERKENIHSHGKEYYRDDISFVKDSYNGRIYYMKASYLCSSKPDGSDIQILSREKEYLYSSIHVNTTGIYLYSIDHGVSITVKRIGFDGSAICEAADEGQIDWVYIYDHFVYYVRSYQDEDDGTDRAEIRRMDMSCGKCTGVYGKAERVSRLYAAETKLVFWARYQNRSREEIYDDGWMVLDLASGKTECLSCDNRSIECVVDDPDVYDEESFRYVKAKNVRKIEFIDLDRGLFWTSRTAFEGEDSDHLQNVYYWEARPLWGNRNKLLENVPVWRMQSAAAGSNNREYFDGMRHYYAQYYYTFASSDVSGGIYSWGHSSHGECDRFTVLVPFLFLNLEAFGEDQYRLSLEETDPIRESWFGKDLPRELIRAWENPAPAVPVNPVVPVQPVPEARTEPVAPAVKEEMPACAPVVPVPTADLLLRDFREMAPALTAYRERLLQYRKSLPNKWDYNAFVGILMSVRGPKYGDAACINLAIGQGDNMKCTDTRLSEMGLQELFLKYRGKHYDPTVTVRQVEDEIVSLVPEYAGIRKFFDETVLSGLSGGSPAAEERKERMEPVARAPREQKEAGERTAEDLFIAKNIGDTDIKYGICTFGSKFHIGFGVPVSVVIGGRTYACKSHNSVKGRIDGMKKVYTDNNIVSGDMFKAAYSAENGTITLSKI